MKTYPILFNTEMVRAVLDGRKTQTRRPLTKIDQCQCELVKDHRGKVDTAALKCRNIRCPYGQSGDRLWVRETWAHPDDNNGIIRYRATSPKLQTRWHPSIHMPRWASRITLEVVSVRVERVWDTSEDDAKAEGCWPLYRYPITDPRGRFPNKDTRSHRSDFMNLWDSIYMARGLGWDMCPWVWVVEFKRVVS